MKKFLCVFCTAVIILLSAHIAFGDGEVFTLPQQITEIAEEAFMGDTSLNTVILPEGLQAIGARAFKNSSLRSVLLPDGLNILCEDAFDDDVCVMAIPGTKGYETAENAGYLLPALSTANGQTAVFETAVTKRSGFTAAQNAQYRFMASGSANGTLSLLDTDGRTLETAVMSEETCFLDLDLRSDETVFVAFTAAEPCVAKLSVGIAGEYVASEGDNVYVSDDAGRICLTFNAERAGNYQMSFESLDGTSASVVLADAGGTALDSASGASASVGAALDKDGTVTLTVTFADCGRHSARFDITQSEDRYLTVGENTLKIGEAGAYAFVAPYDGFFTFTSDSDAEENDPSVTLYDAKGNIIGENDNASEEEKDFSLNCFLAGGTTCCLQFGGVSEGELIVNITALRAMDVAWGEWNVSADVLPRYTCTADAIATFETEADASFRLLDENGGLLCESENGFAVLKVNTGVTVYLLPTGGAAEVLKACEHTVAEAEIGVNTLEEAGGTAWAQLNCDGAQTYLICSNDTEASSVRVFDEDLAPIATDAGSGYGNCFAYTFQTEVGTTYYIECSGTQQLLFKTVTTDEAYLGNMPLTLTYGSSDTLTYTAPMENLYRFSVACETGSTQVAVLKDGEMLGKDTAVEAALEPGDTVTIRIYGTGTDEIAATLTTAYENYETADVIHRALLIGEVGFTSRCKRNEGDVNTMISLLKTVNDNCYSITKKIDLTKDGVKRAIAETFADADDNDVSLFFFASHGIVMDSSTTSVYYGGMKTYDGDIIKTSELAEWLSAVPGKVIVFIGTCGGGAVIEAEATENDIETACKAQAQAITEAFEAADESIFVAPEPIELPNGILVIPKRGELRTSKFEVITAASGNESSWGIESTTVAKSYNFFSKWILQAIAGSGAMPADTDADGTLTTDELYTYIANKAAATPIWYNGETYYQHPQVYPENSDYVLFTR